MTLLLFRVAHSFTLLSRSLKLDTNRSFITPGLYTLRHHTLWNVEARLSRCRCRPASGHDRPSCSHPQPARAMGRRLHFHSFRRTCFSRFARSPSTHLFAGYPYHLSYRRLCTTADYGHA